MQALVTLLLSDGRPGHTQLSRGICAAMQRLRPLHVREIDVRRPRWLPARVLSAMTNAGGQFAGTIPALTGLPTGVEDCDLVVSAGGDTLAASVWLAKSCKCPNVFYGSLRRYRPEDFSLVLTSYQANAGRLHHARTLKPSAFDPDTLPLRQLEAGRLPVVGLLVGGDSGTVRFGDRDWQHLLGLVTALVDQGQAVVVSNSRRTPAAVSDALATLAQSASGSITFVDVRQPQTQTLVALFAACDGMAVTLDSSSMVSEAIWARKPVVALAPAIATLPPLEQGYRHYLYDQGWATSLALSDANPTVLTQSFTLVTPLAANPLDELGALLQRRLPQLFQALPT
jgi:uncharacterized protein